MEVYCGFYLIGMIFLGGSSLLSVMMFWQMQRMRYMISNPLQMAFTRLDSNIMGYLTASWCPGVILQGYMMVKGLLAGMTDAQAQQ